MTASEFAACPSDRIGRPPRISNESWKLPFEVKLVKTGLPLPLIAKHLISMSLSVGDAAFVLVNVIENSLLVDEWVQVADVKSVLRAVFAFMHVFSPDWIALAIPLKSW